ncbi:MAG: hypothetical protein ACLQVN_20375 [Bryobacteraceae bacterium]
MPEIAQAAHYLFALHFFERWHCGGWQNSGEGVVVTDDDVLHGLATGAYFIQRLKKWLVGGIRG